MKSRTFIHHATGQKIIRDLYVPARAVPEFYPSVGPAARADAVRSIVGYVLAATR